MFAFLSLFACAAVVGTLWRLSATFRTVVTNYADVVWTSTQIGALATWDATRAIGRFFVYVAIVAAVYLGLLFIALMTGNAWFVLVVVFIGFIITVPPMLALYWARLPVGAAGDRIRNFGSKWFTKTPIIHVELPEWLAFLEPKKPDPIHFGNSDTWKNFFLRLLESPFKVIRWIAQVGLAMIQIIGQVPILAINGMIITVTIPVKLTGGAIYLLGGFAQTIEDVMYELTRFLARLNMFLLLLASITLADIRFGWNLVDPVLFIFVSIPLILWLTLKIFTGDPLAEYRTRHAAKNPVVRFLGLPKDVKFMATLTIVLLMLVSVDVILPRYTRELGLQNQVRSKHLFTRSRIIRESGDITGGVYHRTRVESLMRDCHDCKVDDSGRITGKAGEPIKVEPETWYRSVGDDTPGQLEGTLWVLVHPTINNDPRRYDEKKIVAVYKDSLDMDVSPTPLPSPKWKLPWFSLVVFLLWIVPITLVGRFAFKRIRRAYFGERTTGTHAGAIPEAAHAGHPNHGGGWEKLMKVIVTAIAATILLCFVILTSFCAWAIKSDTDDKREVVNNALMKNQPEAPPPAPVNFKPNPVALTLKPKEELALGLYLLPGDEVKTIKATSVFAKTGFFHFAMAPGQPAIVIQREGHLVLEDQSGTEQVVEFEVKTAGGRILSMIEPFKVLMQVKNVRNGPIHGYRILPSGGRDPITSEEGLAPGMTLDMKDCWTSNSFIFEGGNGPEPFRIEHARAELIHVTP